MSGLARAQALLAAHRPADALTELASLPAAEALGGPAAKLRWKPALSAKGCIST